MDATTVKKEIDGGSFLIESCTPEEIFAPEDFSEEHRMIADTCREFVASEVAPNVAGMENHDWQTARDLVRKAGDLGLHGATVPEELGGLDLDQTTAAIIAEYTGTVSGFGVTLSAHATIGMLPILYFGSEELKRKWIPPIVAGETVAAYCLTEPGSGSDALGAKTIARLSEDGTEYILSGEKMWITNGGFADVFIVFAKVDGDRKKFSAFLVERSENCRPGAEEHKMGIKASSTTAIILSDARVPVGNLIGSVGDGAKIAFNILNVGRFKLGAAVVGGAKTAINHAVRYANERHQFGVPVSSFGAIKYKLAEMAIRTWVAESITYRTVGMIDSLIGDGADEEKKLRSIDEYAVECSINKVACSETLDYVVDETVQIYGGYGYSADYPAEKFYRDSRINRIFEGTNEINRMLIPGQLLKRAAKGGLALFEAVSRLQDELTSLPPLDGSEETGVVLSHEARLAENAKKIALLILGTASQKFGERLSEQQEILMGAADVIMDAYQMESATLRAQKSAGKDNAEYQIMMAQIFCFDAMNRIETRAKATLAALASGDELSQFYLALRRLAKNNAPFDSFAVRRRIADALIEANKYIF